MWTQTEPVVQVPDNMTVELVGGDGGGLLESSVGSAAIGAITALVVVMLGYWLQQRLQKRQWQRDNERFERQLQVEGGRWVEQMDEQRRQSVRADFLRACTKIFETADKAMSELRKDPELDHMPFLLTIADAAFQARLLASTEFYGRYEDAFIRLGVDIDEGRSSPAGLFRMFEERFMNAVRREIGVEA